MRQAASALLATVRAGVPGPTAARAGRRTYRAAGRAAWVAVSAAPAVAFVVVDAVHGLAAASIALAVAAPTVFVVQLLLRRPPGAAALTLLVATVCGVVAALVGEARAFFLLPTLFPAGLVLVLLVSLLMGRPLTGVLLNGLARGPRDWYHHDSLRRVYVVSTWLAVVLSVANSSLRAASYVADQMAALTALSVVAAPVALALAAGTVAAARPAAALARARTGRPAVETGARPRGPRARPSCSGGR